MKNFFTIIIFTLLPLLTAAAKGDQDSISSIKSICIDSVSVDSMTIADTLNIDTTLTVQDKIEKLLDSKMFDTSQVGLMVWDLDSDSLVFAHNEHQIMRPASTLKLLTAVTALNQLGKDYTIYTQVYKLGACDSTGFNGNVYIKGNMDPTFSSADLDAFVYAIQGLQRDTIRGRLVADLSFKDSDLQGKGWCWDDDNPVLSPLLYKRKDNFLPALRERLRKVGIVVLGEDSTGVVPKGARLIAERGTTVESLFKKMMKNSDNLYAESVLYQLGAATGCKSTAERSIAEEKRLLKKIGLNPDSYKIADGSGLSLYNYLSPEAEIKLLRYAYKDKSIYNILYSNLPVAGVDGTIKSRLKNSALRGKVRAKTGTLTGISTLAGYLTNKQGCNLAFCIFNQGVLSARKAKNFQDNVLKLLY